MAERSQATSSSRALASAVFPRRTAAGLPPRSSQSVRDHTSHPNKIKISLNQYKLNKNVKNVKTHTGSGHSRDKAPGEVCLGESQWAAPISSSSGGMLEAPLPLAHSRPPPLRVDQSAPPPWGVCPPHSDPPGVSNPASQPEGSVSPEHSRSEPTPLRVDQSAPPFRVECPPQSGLSGVSNPASRPEGFASAKPSPVPMPVPPPVSGPGVCTVLSGGLPSAASGP